MAIAESHPITDQYEEIAVKNPITNEQIGLIPIQTATEVQAAVERARVAQPAWETRSVKERARILHRWADGIWEDRQHVIRKLREETGKTETSAFAEILVIDSLVQYYKHHAHKILKLQKRRALFPVIQSSKVSYKAHGVVGLIEPWNYPFAIPMMDVVPALIAGNAVVLKPSEATPFIAELCVQRLHEAGIPKDILQIVHGDGRTGTALIDLADFIQFTGSTATGRKVATRAAKRLIPYSLELGGKDPSIILEDANLDMTATGLLRGAFENAGQMCTSVERVYAVEAIYHQLVDRIVQFANDMVISAADGLDIHMGSLSNQQELDRTKAHIQDAVAKGAKVVSGGNPLPELGPLFFEPTILADVDHTMDIMREETFGPVLPIMKVANTEEAVRLANDTPYGLSSSIFSKDLKHAEQLAYRLDTGDVNVNVTQLTWGTPSLPTGGQRSSGIGRRNGPEGLLKYVSMQSVLMDSHLGQKPELALLAPRTLRFLLILRKLRRYFSFL